MGDLSRSVCDFVALASPGVRGLHPYQPGKPTAELERELGLDNIVKLASNENPLGLSAVASAAIQAALPELTRYPDGNGFELKQALSRFLDVPSNALTLGNGSNDLLDLIARAYAGPGTEVIYSQYAFAVYALSTQAVNATAVVTPAKDWGHDLDAMLAAVTDKTSLIYIANPNNPTGTLLPELALRSFLDQLPERIVVVLDEAYFEYLEAAQRPDGLCLLGSYPNLIVTRTFSKAWGLAGLRVGYAISSEEIADILNRVRHPFNVNSVAMVAATSVLQDLDYLERGRQLNAEGLQQLAEGISALGLSFIPSVGNFLCFDAERPGLELYSALLKHGVIVRPVANYGMPNHLRVSVGLPSENQRFLDVLAKVI